MPASYDLQTHLLDKDTLAVQSAVEAALLQASFVCSDWKTFIKTGVRIELLLVCAASQIIGLETIGIPPKSRNQASYWSSLST